MADQNLSLIPYASDRMQVVLRHGSAVVLYDDRSKQISLRRSDEVADDESSQCPLCGKAMGQDGPENTADDESPLTTPVAAGFVKPGYFRMLHNSRTPSRQPSPVSPPQLRLEQLDADPSSLETRGRSLPTVSPESTPYSHEISPDAFSQNYFKTFFVEERELGRGGKGVVLLVRHVIDGVDLGRFACKRVPVGNDSEWLRRVLLEVQLLQILSHANLVSYRHVWLENIQINQFSPAVPCAFILQQYCNAGDLHHYIFGANRTSTTEELKQRMRTRSKTHMDPPEGMHKPRRLQFEEIFSFFRDITSGLNYLHRKNYIHRDLKPSNCLLHRTGPHVRVLVSDFGEMQGADAVRKSTGSTGTISFCAPEVLREISPGVYGNFSQKSDVFSLGLIVYLMCFGRLPYASADTAAEENEDIDQLKDEISSWTGMDVEHRDRSDLPERLYKSLKLLLSLDPNERPGTEEILASIKAGSALHEPGHVKSGANPPLREYDNSSGEHERGIGVGMGSSESRRKPSALALASSSSEADVTAGEGRRTSSPRMPMVSGTVQRRLSIEAGTKQGFQLGGQRLLRGPASGSWGQQAWAKAAVFCFKVVTCMAPCSPFAPRGWIAYPLLAVAALELQLQLDSSWSRAGVSVSASAVLLAVHLGVLVAGASTQSLCLAYS